VAIVLLDDDEDILDTLGNVIRVVSDKGCIAFRTLAELVSRREEVLASDMAILDINLGADEPSGLDVYGWLRQSGYTAPVVFLTGHGANHPLVVQACSMGDARVVRKPIGMDEMRAVIEARRP
jgi:FixJ family two-component response regulator